MKLSRQEIAITAATVAVLLIVAAVFVAIFGVYTNSYTTDYSPIYLSSGKNKFFHATDSVVLGDVQFRVHNAWTSDSRYSMQILPTGEDFYYKLDGKWYSFLDSIEDLTPGFNVVVDGSKFTLRAKSMTMQDVLSALNNGKDVEIASDDVDKTAHYKLVVSTFDDKYSVSITFRCAMIGVGDVDIDPPSLLI